jgi:hypothetical protein
MNREQFEMLDMQEDDYFYTDLEQEEEDSDEDAL